MPLQGHARGENRDHIPTRENKLDQKMGEGSLEDGVSFKMEAGKRKPFYRKHQGKDYKPEPYEDMMVSFGDY